MGRGGGSQKLNHQPNMVHGLDLDLLHICSRCTAWSSCGSPNNGSRSDTSLIYLPTSQTTTAVHWYTISFPKMYSWYCEGAVPKSLSPGCLSLLYHCVPVNNFYFGVIISCARIMSTLIVHLCLTKLDCCIDHVENRLKLKWDVVE